MPPEVAMQERLYEGGNGIAAFSRIADEYFLSLFIRYAGWCIFAVFTRNLMHPCGYHVYNNSADGKESSPILVHVA
jgi:hypothetical protein